MKWFKLAAVLLFLTPAGMSGAEDFHCEVMNVQGDAFFSNGIISHQKIAEGDLLGSGDLLETGANCRLDIAYDADWNNVTTLEPGCSMRIKSIQPTCLELAKGSVFARLEHLPKDSSFEVQTPAGVAAVRGTDFWTRYGEDGLEVYNYSPSTVELLGVDAQGNRLATRVFLKQNEVAGILRRGLLPGPPRRMNKTDLQRCQGFLSRIRENVRGMRAKGRLGKVQKIGDMERERLRRKSIQPAAQGKSPVKIQEPYRPKAGFQNKKSPVPSDKTRKSILQRLKPGNRQRQ